MRDKTDFLIAAVQEARETIKALDVKLAALLVAVCIPIPLLGSITQCVASILSTQIVWWNTGLIGISLAGWLAAGTAFSLAIGAIDNPSARIPNSSSLKGALYSPGLFELGLTDAFFNRGLVRCSRDTASHLQAIPSTEAEILPELAFEHLKLIYIRDLKIYRMKIGFRLMGLSLGCALIIWCFGRFGTQSCGT